MRLPKELVSQITLDSLRRVGAGGWKRREEMASPMVDGWLEWTEERLRLIVVVTVFRGGVLWQADALDDYFYYGVGVSFGDDDSTSCCRRWTLTAPCWLSAVVRRERCCRTS